MRSSLISFLLPAVLGIGGCISVHQIPLPDNRAVADNYTRAAAGDPTALRVQASAYRSGMYGVGKDADEARRLLLLAAEAGDAAAQLELGRLYMGQDRQQAQYWVGRQAQQGNRGAVELLARLHGDARYGPPDPVAALGWALVGGNRYLIEQYRKNLTPEQSDAAQSRADAWLARYPLAERKVTKP